MILPIHDSMIQSDFRFYGPSIRVTLFKLVWYEAKQQTDTYMEHKFA